MMRTRPVSGAYEEIDMKSSSGTMVISRIMSARNGMLPFSTATSTRPSL